MIFLKLYIVDFISIQVIITKCPFPRILYINLSILKTHIFPRRFINYFEFFIYYFQYVGY